MGKVKCRRRTGVLLGGFNGQLFVCEAALEGHPIHLDLLDGVRIPSSSCRKVGLIKDLLRQSISDVAALWHERRAILCLFGSHCPCALAASGGHTQSGW